MHANTARCLDAVRSRDRSMDGAFVAAVVTTGVYCRPSCPGVVRANEGNLRFLAGPLEARAAGYRACKRCDPDASVALADEAAAPEQGTAQGAASRATMP